MKKVKWEKEDIGVYKFRTLQEGTGIELKFYIVHCTAEEHEIDRIWELIIYHDECIYGVRSEFRTLTEATKFVSDYINGRKTNDKPRQRVASTRRSMTFRSFCSHCDSRYVYVCTNEIAKCDYLKKEMNATEINCPLWKRFPIVKK